MTQPTAQQPEKNRIIPLGILIVFAYWLLESFIDSFLFGSALSFRDALFPKNGEILTRIAVVGLILAFSVYAHITVVRYRRLEGICRINEYTQESLLNATTEAAMLLSLDGTIRALNEKAAEDFGARPADVIGKNAYDLMPPDSASRRRAYQQTVIATKQALRIEDRQGERWFDIHVYPVADTDGLVVQCAVFSREITESKIMEHELKRLSTTDNLTGLFNQRQFIERIEQEVDRAKRMRYALCLVIMDVDDFKAYNDTYGHLKGNEILGGIGDIIGRCIRKDVDSAYRFGGDEFALILPYADQDTAAGIVQRVYDRTKGELGGVTVSYGIAQLSEQTTVQELIHSADKSMYIHKGRTRKTRRQGH